MNRRRKRVIRCASGQMAVFVALIFQVLFVFFAMVINVGLIVHDKINLQNAVDLGAFYGAQKQAEMLNEIAHINYQIRQDYKLLAWRTRVMGTLGRDSHPQREPNAPQEEVPYLDPLSTSPGVCIAHPFWVESYRRSTQENLCRQTPNFVIPPIPPIQIIFPSGANFAFRGLVENLRNGFDVRCDTAGPLNWLFTAYLNYGYRRSVARRKEMIKQLSENLSNDIVPGQNAFLDTELGNVYEGIRKTVTKNLTTSNETGGLEIQVINGLKQGGVCDQGDLNYPRWIREISIDPVLMYTNFDSSGGCALQVRYLRDVPGGQGLNGQPVPGNLDVVLGGPMPPLLGLYAAGEPPVGDPVHSTRGFEKNPWCKVYVGVKARTRPRKPFAPFGSPVTLEARAFAAPFGGRIGPWDKAGWAPGTFFSSGQEIDQVAVPRTMPGVGPNLNDERMRPNYARFPGDQLGLRSRAAINATKPSLFGPPSQGATTNNQALLLSLSNYDDLTRVDDHGDVLAWDTRNGGFEPAVRTAELAAIAPDLFDITYYSIEPNYYGHYLSSPQRAQQRFLGFFPLSDAGSRRNRDDLRAFNVRRQVAQGTTLTALMPDAFWMVRNSSHTLTGWTRVSSTDFTTFPTGLFGSCSRIPDPQQNEPSLPGDCIDGGRTGYSVRIVHRDYLLSQEHRFGGADPGTGPILNPPPDEF